MTGDPLGPPVVSDAVLGHQASDRYFRGLQDLGISYLFAGEDGRDLSLAMATLAEDFGAETLLLRGGGIVNGAMLKAGLIDEFSVLMSPSIDGLSGTPAIVNYLGDDGDQPAEGQALRFLATEVLCGGMVWLHYAVEKAQ